MINQRDSALTGWSGRRPARLIRSQQLNHPGHDLFDAATGSLRLERMPVTIGDRQTPLQLPGQFEGSIGPFTLPAGGGHRFRGVVGHSPGWRIDGHHHACAASTGAMHP